MGLFLLNSNCCSRHGDLLCKQDVSRLRLAVRIQLAVSSTLFVVHVGKVYAFPVIHGGVPSRGDHHHSCVKILQEYYYNYYNYNTLYLIIIITSLFFLSSHNG